MNYFDVKTLKLKNIVYIYKYVMIYNLEGAVKK